MKNSLLLELISGAPQQRVRWKLPVAGEAARSEVSTTAGSPACPGAGGKCLRLGESGWAPIQCVLVQQESQKVARIPEKRVEEEV